MYHLLPQSVISDPYTSNTAHVSNFHISSHNFHACGHKWEGDDGPGQSSIDSETFSYSPSCYYTYFITDNSTTTLYLQPQW